MLATLLKLTQIDERFVMDQFEPAYLKLFRAGKIEERVTAGLRELEDCCACPRNCHINRLQNEARGDLQLWDRANLTVVRNKGVCP